MEVRPVDHGGGWGDGDGTRWEWEDARRICMRMAHRYARNSSEVEDIAQEALLRAWRRRSTLRDRGARKQWLAAIVRNEAFRQYNRLRPDPVNPQDHEPGGEDERVLAMVERADLHAALRRLDERDRLLVSLRYGQDLTQAGIARRLGIPEGTVKVRLHRVRARLRREIGTV